MNNSEVSENVSFKSYVIYDLETTTLPSYGIAKITELSAIGVIKDHILNLMEGEDQPRVLNKITLCINPRKMVSLEAERLTGLSNHLLEASSPFDEHVFGMLEDFINRLPQPVCLIAHNGNKFDFPILQAEVQRIGKRFGDNVWCADSLPAFQYLYLDQPRQSFMDSQMASKNTARSVELESMLHQFREMDSVLCDALDSAEKAMQGQDLTMGFGQEDASHSSLGQDMSLRVEVDTSSLLNSPSRMPSMQKINETTPKRQAFGQFVPKVARATSMPGAGERCSYTPEPSNGATRPRRKVPVRSLIKEFNDSLVDRPKAFKLSDVYAHACRRPPLAAHSAEADSMMLLQSIMACRSGFLPWVDKNASPFNSIRPFRY